MNGYSSHFPLLNYGYKIKYLLTVHLFVFISQIKKKKKKNLSQTLNFTNTPIFQEKKQKK